LRRAAAAEGSPWTRIDVVAETGPTNADLIARANAGDDIDGTVLLAEYQSANDVLVDDRKLAGILAEVAGRAILVGIGINAAMTSAEAPDPRATSLLMLDVPDDRNALAAAVLRHLGARVAAWREGNGADEALPADYRSRSVTLGSRVRATLPGGATVDGEATAIDELGRLQIRTGESTEPVSASDITHLRPLAS
jgi:BirA family transcriptional regulator, biotin operon repressor / biotin---[acetyl-CoA-carboxylase] ligase